MCVMAQRSINPVADILVAIVLHGKKDYVKNTTHNIQRHVTGYLQSTPGKLHLPTRACLPSPSHLINRGYRKSHNKWLTSKDLMKLNPLNKRLYCESRGLPIEEDES